VEQLGRHTLTTGDIVFSRRGDVGRFAVVTPEESGWLCGTGSIRIRLNSPDISIEYIRRYLQQRWIGEWLEHNAKGVTMLNLNTNIIRALPVTYPPLKEQKRIAAILDQADQIRKKRKRALDRLNQLGDAVFQEMFGDLATNPKAWDVAKLGDLCVVGSSKRVFVEDFVEDGVPFFRGTEIGKLAEGENINPDLFISSSHYDELIHHSGKPEIGDLLLPSICHDGRIWRVNSSQPFYFKDGRVLWIKNNESAIDGEYLRNYLRNLFVHNYTSIASGTTFAELKIVNLKNLSILCPPIKLQIEFSDKIREIAGCRSRLIPAEKFSTSLFASLQHRAFNGELTAKAAERELAEAV
jgi:type I restriction enzyme S subunit